MKYIILFIFTGLALSLSAQSTAGNWSRKDKKMLKKVVKEVEGELDVLGDKKKPYINCYVEKIQLHYSSFYVANEDLDGCEKIAMDCITEVLGIQPGVQKGNGGAEPTGR